MVNSISFGSKYNVFVTRDYTNKNGLGVFDSLENYLDEKNIPYRFNMIQPPKSPFYKYIRSINDLLR